MTAKATTALVVFDVDDLHCAIPAEAVIEVVRAVALRLFPGQADFVAGALDYHANAVPVLDLRVRLGRARRPLSPADQLVLVRVHARIVALLVDRVIEIVAGEPDTGTRSGLLVGDRSLCGVATTPQGLVLVHDPSGFIGECEADALAAAVQR